LIFLLQMCVILAACRLCGWGMRRARGEIPQIPRH
jgi:hypothetical protein